MAQGNLGARDAVVDVILLVGLPGALAAGLFRWAGRLDQRAADRPASQPRRCSRPASGPSRRSPEHRFRGSSPYGPRF